MGNGVRDHTQRAGRINVVFVHDSCLHAMLHLYMHVACMDRYIGFLHDASMHTLEDDSPRSWGAASL